MLLSDYLFRKASSQKIPVSAAFELSPVCNFHCKMCYVRKTEAQIRKEGKALIPWQRWLELAKQAKEAGTLFLLLTGGEPFLYPGFRELYTELHRMGFLISINTNGSLINEETLQWLKELCPYRINLTLYGASRETYGRICGNESGYDRAVWALRSLKEAGIPVLINASMIPENACDLEAIMTFGKELGVNTRVSTYMFPPIRRDAEEEDSRFTPEESAEMFMKRVLFPLPPEKRLEQLRAMQRPTEPHEEDWGAHRDDFMRCRAGRCSFWVSWDGNMCACGLVPFPKNYDPFREPLLDCWMDLTEKVRHTPVLKGCSNCPKRELCAPCVATIYAECGDVNQKAPYLCSLTQCISQQIDRYMEEYANEEAEVISK